MAKPNGKLELNNQMQQSQLNPKIDDDDDDGIIMCHGRFINVDLPEKTKTPLLVPRNERKVHLLVEDYHKKLFHAGVNHTLSQIRTTYWILNQLRTFFFTIPRILLKDILS